MSLDNEKDERKERRDERIELLKKDRSELIKNVSRSKRKLRGALDSIDALWPDEGSTEKEKKIKEDLIKKPIRSALFVLNVCWQILADEQNNSDKKEVKQE